MHIRYALQFFWNSKKNAVLVNDHWIADKASQSARHIIYPQIGIFHILKFYMKTNIVNEVSRIWSQFTKDATDTDLVVPVTLQKKLLNLFHVGDYYYYVFNVKSCVFELMSEEIFSVLGYERQEVDVPFLLGKIHLDDQSYFVKFENKVAEFFSSLNPEQIFNYKVSYDYRIQKKDGSYIRILQQVITIQIDKNKQVIKTFGVHTNISHLKPAGIPVLSFIGLNGAPSHINIDIKNKLNTGKTLLTRREQEVLQLLAQGQTSDEISSLLFISKQTVDTHRKNLLRKTECSNTVELMSESIKRGWI